MTRLAPLYTPGLAARLGPFHAAGLLAGVDVHVVDHLAARSGGGDGDVLLALALATRAPRVGDLCFDLSATPDLPAGDEDEPPPALEWPADREAWRAAVARHPLVRAGGEARATAFVLDGTLLYTDRTWDRQQRLAAALLDRAASTRAVFDPALLRDGLRCLFGAPPPDRQQLGAAMALLRGLTVISGGPGMGKTWTVRNVLTLLHAQAAAEGRPLRIALAAPTGKAAARLTESLHAGLDAWLAGVQPALGPRLTPAALRAALESVEASTLHRLLGFRPDAPDNIRYHADRPLPHDVVIVDEASMIDFALMARLVDALAPRTRLILLGDQHQLASVEAGTVLRDLCAGVDGGRPTLSAAFLAELRAQAGLDLGPHVTATPGGPLRDCIVQLDRNRRFDPGSGIGAFARACLAGDPDAAVEVFTGGRFPDVSLVPHAPDGGLRPEVADLMVDGWRPWLEALGAGAGAAELLRLFGRFRVLAAHRAGRLGVEGLNPWIEDRLQAASPRAFDPRLRMYRGRPVMVTRNDYDVGLYNGDVGLVVQARPGVVAFPGTDEPVRSVATARLPPHETVFAMTIHKSQGSELDHALVVLPRRPSAVVTRELVYTAVTRARQRVTLVADPALLAEALGRTVERASGLRRALWGAWEN